MKLPRQRELFPFPPGHFAVHGRLHKVSRGVCQRIARRNYQAQRANAAVDAESVEYSIDSDDRELELHVSKQEPRLWHDLIRA